MISYLPKLARNPRLGRAMAKIHRILQEEQLMASVVITNGADVEHWMALDPPWSICKANRTGEGEVGIRVQSSSKEYPTKEEQVKHIGTTIIGFMGLFDVMDKQRGNLRRLMDMISHKVGFTSVGRDVTGQSPDIPATLDDALDTLLAGMPDEDRESVREMPLEEFLAKAHHVIGRTIRNDFKLYDAESPLVNEFCRVFNIFGHPDDISGYLLTQVWGKVKGLGRREYMELCVDRIERSRQHWIKEGKDPVTGKPADGEPDNNVIQFPAP